MYLSIYSFKLNWKDYIISILKLSCLLKTASQVCLSSVIEEPLYLKAFLSSQNSKDLG